MDYPEAPASVSYTIKTKNGFSAIFTMRDTEAKELVNKMSTIEEYWLKTGVTPDIKTYGKPPSNPVEYVEGRNCPNCGNKLVYFEIKTKPGIKHIRCSTQKYDFTTKQTVGCQFTEWAK